MKTVFIMAFGLLVFSVVAAERPSGAYLGAKSAETPHWFKESFLEFEHDVAEAAQNNRRVMLYFHQDGCPYCARLVEENFADPEIEAYVRDHFDGIEINMWGDREIVSVGGKHFSEKTFAAALKVQYTPTVIFLDEQGKVALRLNGYYPPEKFRLALRFVADRAEQKQSFNEFVMARLEQPESPLISEDFFLQEIDLQANRKSSNRYLAIYLEAPGCDQCRVMHESILADPPTRALAKEMDSVQLNIHSPDPVVTPSGQRTTQKDYARQLNIAYTPSVVFLNSEGQEVHRIDGFLKTFHFQSTLAYVLEQAYISEPSFQRYIAARGEKLRDMGYDTDIWGYRSFHPAK